MDQSWTRCGGTVEVGQAQIIPSSVTLRGSFQRGSERATLALGRARITPGFFSGLSPFRATGRKTP